MQDTAQATVEGGDKKVGKLVILSGPSGGGKNTILSGDKNTGTPGVFQLLPKLRFVPSNTTRTKRTEEQDGLDYNFWSRDDFEESAKHNGFLEYVEYSGNYYGSSRKDIEAALKEGTDVLLVITVDGCKEVLKASFVEIPRPEIITIFIAPPSIDVLRHRLERRSNVASTLEKRLEAAAMEIEEGKRIYDHVVLNEEGKLYEAVLRVTDIISGGVVSKTEDYVKAALGGETSGHDWWHIKRVLNNAISIARKEEGADIYVVQLAALLHDIADYKFHGGDESIGPATARKWLLECGVQEGVIDHVCEIIKTLSFRGSQHNEKMKTLEGQIVQDADRLDALGAIGIARAFATGSKFDEVIHDPDIQVQQYGDAQDYVIAKGKKGRTVINHFYEKLLLLKDRMNTESGKKMAEGRHEFMELYLKRFFGEWQGDC